MPLQIQHLVVLKVTAVVSKSALISETPAQNRLKDQQINKTHLQDLLKDKECCEGMIKYANVDSHESYYIIENLLSQVTGDGTTRSS
ncbi:hypothetical protein CY35_05G057500 [Sphagnum magellanicum]|nr:hypothetical protein CY35_05G057500 [Sphagnum magellanicum]